MRMGSRNESTVHKIKTSGRLTSGKSLNLQLPAFISSYLVLRAMGVAKLWPQRGPPTQKWFGGVWRSVIYLPTR